MLKTEMKVQIEVAGIMFSAITDAARARKTFDEICDECLADHAWLIDHNDKTVEEYFRAVLKMGGVDA